MTNDALPLSRLVPVDRLPARGEVVRVEASEDERTALARDFGLPGIASLVGEFRVSGDARRAGVTGVVRGRVTRTCVVTLEPFEAQITEEVDVDFAPASEPASEEEAALRAIDPPDEIVDGRIDLGALTAEFLALGLDPYPRKPDAAFEPVIEDADVSPFAGLKSMKGPKGGG
ncbi:YceD family protein [Salinarimonas chemoclinalis]|uniref:YceD family protein n=1 Tax=Salinarimonas chemoclinalis TaxID=3241599 RepID=UPI0035585A10